MKRQIIRYSIVFAASLIILLLLFRRHLPFGGDNTSFAVDQKNEITKIELQSGEKRLFLQKSGDTWRINNRDEARKSAVLFILRTISEIRIKSPVAPQIFENEIIKKEITPVKVIVYKNRKILKSFFVYKTGSNIYGNIMKMRSSSKPFIVYIPGYEDNIGAHFVTDELFWKPYTVFNLLPSQIISVKLENIKDSSASFRIDRLKNSYSLSGLRKEITGWDTARIKRYLTYYTAVSFYTWAFDLVPSGKQDIESTAPLYRITVETTDGEEKILTIWEKTDSTSGMRKPDTDMVWAKTNARNDVFIMKYFDLDPILKKRSYFLTDTKILPAAIPGLRK